MGKWAKLRDRILLGKSDANISFVDLCGLLSDYGFKGRIKGSHHIFFRKDIEEIINIQREGKMAKPYQVKQIRNIIIKYKLTQNYEK